LGWRSQAIVRREPGYLHSSGCVLYPLKF